MTKKIVTTLGPGGWELYGKRFADSFAQYWPADIELDIWCHHLDELPTHPRAKFYSLDKTESFSKIAKMSGAAAKDGPSLNYAFKAVALAQAVRPELDWIAFVDADTETMRPITDDVLTALFFEGCDLTYLWRKSAAESEGSWFAFNLQTKAGASLLADYWGLYDSGEAFKLKKAHDNAVLDHLVLIHRAHGLRVGNLSDGALGLDAFHQSILGGYMIHYKGPNKDTIANPGLSLPSRYSTLMDYATHAYKVTGRANVVEVGTWNGSRAVQFAETLFSAGATTIKYVGFDTFDQGNDRTHEGHSKPDAQLDLVDNRLDNYKRLCARRGLTFDYTLVQGNTLTTLPASDELVADAAFAYIDGGHSYETTKSDYECLKHVPYVVFDDLIQNEEPHAPEGPRRVMAEITDGTKQIWNSGDGYVGLSQTICFGIRTLADFPLFEIRQSLRVKPVDSVDKREQFGYIAENTAAIHEWVRLYQAHERKALLISGGPTIPQFVNEIAEKQKAGAVIFAVKHAVPMLRAANIKPDYIVVLDPRPAEGKSTHGILRTDLFESVEPGDKILLATMTHPSVRKLLEEKKARVIGWHALTQGLQEAGLPELAIGMTIGGGTCAATRLPTLAYVMGFRRLDFYGYDFYYPSDTKQENLKQQLMTVGIGSSTNSKMFLTTGELVAAIQDLDVWAKWMVQNNLSVQFFGDGAGPVVWQTVVPNYKMPAEYTK